MHIEHPNVKGLIAHVALAFSGVGNKIGLNTSTIQGNSYIVFHDNGLAYFDLRNPGAPVVALLLENIGLVDLVRGDELAFRNSLAAMGVDFDKIEGAEVQPVKASWEHHQNPQVATLHVKAKLPSVRFDYGKIDVGFDKKPADLQSDVRELIENLGRLEGIDSVSIKPYEIFLVKAVMYDWQELKPTIINIVTKYLGRPLAVTAKSISSNDLMCVLGQFTFEFPAEQRYVLTPKQYIDLLDERIEAARIIIVDNHTVKSATGPDTIHADHALYAAYLRRSRNPLTFNQWVNAGRPGDAAAVSRDSVANPAEADDEVAKKDFDSKAQPGDADFGR